MAVAASNEGRTSARSGVRGLFHAFWRSPKLGWRAARGLIYLYVGVVTLLVLLENQLIFHPTKYPGGGDWSVAGAPPPRAPAGQIVARIEDVELTASDGVRLHGWWATPMRWEDNAPVPVQTNTTLLYLHGNGGNVTSRYESVERLARLPARVFIVDWRGYGKSDGSPFEQGVYRDARAAWRYLIEQRGARPDQIILVGESLGNAPAILLATEQQPAGLLVQAAFTSIPDMARGVFPFVPRFLIRTRMNNLERIARISCPVLIAHSPTDEVIPFAHGRRLFEAAPEPKQFYEVPGAGHNDMDRVGGADYFSALREFIRTCRAGRGEEAAPAADEKRENKGEGVK